MPFNVQTADDARHLLTYIDPTLGKPLPEKDYGGNCRIYDPENPANPWHNFWVSCDCVLWLCVYCAKQHIRQYPI